MDTTPKPITSRRHRHRHRRHRKNHHRHHLKTNPVA
jgi:hypothetical protein